LHQDARLGTDATATPCWLKDGWDVVKDANAAQQHRCILITIFTNNNTFIVIIISISISI